MEKIKNCSNCFHFKRISRISGICYKHTVVVSDSRVPYELDRDYSINCIVKGFLVCVCFKRITNKEK